MMRVWRWVIGAVASLSLLVAVVYVHKAVSIGAGYKAKILCSALFVSKRQPDVVLAEDLKVDGLELLEFFPFAIDRERPSVEVSVFGLVKRRAVYRDGLGCTLAIGKTEEELRSETPYPDHGSKLISTVSRQKVTLTATGNPVEFDQERLAVAIDGAFAESNPDALKRTRALVVVHQGQIVAERYAEGFSQHMPLLGWSMAKSALNALVGIRLRQGKLALSDRRLLPEWSDDQDPRSHITLNDLLRMTSGLSFSERYQDTLSDVVVMLFAKGDKAAFAAAKRAEHVPGSRWSYSGGNSNIISHVLRLSFQNKLDYLTFPNRELFSRLGMENAVIEPDASGTFAASSFMYATARDWARLGLLFLRDGLWEDRRILPQGWVAMGRRPKPTAGEGAYGLHLWLKLPMSAQGGEPPLPEDAYYMLGHEGQIVAIIPSLDLVVVRMGLARKPDALKPAELLSSIAAVFSQKREE